LTGQKKYDPAEAFKVTIPPNSWSIEHFK
jgi:hypothetical protein